MTPADDGSARFSRGDLALLRELREVRIETRGGTQAPVHRTIIWVVVDARDRVLVRTYLGPASRWYREAISLGTARLLANDRTFEVQVHDAGDADRIATCSEELLRKYADDPATPAMVADRVLNTTLELTPA